MDGGRPDVTTQASGASRVGRNAPRILRFVPDADWRARLSLAAVRGVRHRAAARAGCPTGLRRRGGATHGLTVLVDLDVDRAEAGAPEHLFTTLPLPTTDPRQPPAIGQQAVAAIAGPDSAVALADWWGGADPGAARCRASPACACWA